MNKVILIFMILSSTIVVNAHVLSSFYRQFKTAAKNSQYNLEYSNLDCVEDKLNISQNGRKEVDKMLGDAVLNLAFYSCSILSNYEISKNLKAVEKLLPKQTKCFKSGFSKADLNGLLDCYMEPIKDMAVGLNIWPLIILFILITIASSLGILLLHVLLFKCQ
ncbi:hypothetical protein ACKWTF_014828 [Chironomus riparius]